MKAGSQGHNKRCPTGGLSPARWGSLSNDEHCRALLDPVVPKTLQGSPEAHRWSLHTMVSLFLLVRAGLFNGHTHIVALPFSVEAGAPVKPTGRVSGALLHFV